MKLINPLNNVHHFLSPYLLVLLLFAEPFLARARSSCPLQSASKCFQKFFSTYRFMEWPSCQTFDFMEKCFSFAPHQCDQMELAQLSSTEYRKTHNSYLPKEAILAVHENLRQRCHSNCHRNSEHECLSKLSTNEFQKDKDQALLMELSALKKQLDLNMSPPSSACLQIRTVLRRLQLHRKNQCDEKSVYCLCNRLIDDLPCSFKCDQYYRLNKNRSWKIDQSPVLSIVTIFVWALICW